MGATGEDPDRVDLLIVGAGLSGIGMAAHLRRECPGKSFLLLEARGAVGGTWDQFRYPGIRSDSDMFTMGYRFKPWTHPVALAPGGLILEYIRETAREHGIDRLIRFHHRVVTCDWDSATATWTVAATLPDGTSRSFRARYLMSCAGYYEFDHGHTPVFPGRQRFSGHVIHPQFWPSDFDVAGRRIAIIGSGATAMTLAPALAATAAHVTMVQRSPTYVVSTPARDEGAERLQQHLPVMWAYRLSRFRSIAYQVLTYQLARRMPHLVKRRLVDAVAKQLGGAGDISDFTPTYNPWDQRICLVPDGDLFAEIRAGRLSVVTGGIASFTGEGLELTDGTRIAADTIVTATGFDLRVQGDARTTVDGRRFDPAGALVYRGGMFADVPNLGFIVGYTNASWTLKVDLMASYFCRLINAADRRGATVFTPRNRDPEVRPQPLMPLTSGYIKRAQGLLPHEGDRRPWRLAQNFVLDTMSLRLGRIDDGVLEFSDPTRAASTPGSR